MALACGWRPVRAPLQQGGVEPAPSNYLSFREWAGARNTALASRISKPFI